LKISRIPLCISVLVKLVFFFNHHPLLKVDVVICTKFQKLYKFPVISASIVAAEPDTGVHCS